MHLTESQSGLDETLLAQDQVLHDPHLLFRIAEVLTVLGRLRFSALNKTTRAAVDAPELWTVVAWEGLGGSEKSSWTYSEAAQFGNRLGSVLRQYGRHCARLCLANCPWLQVTGLEDIARCVNLAHLDMSGCRHYSVDLLGSLVRHCPRLRSLRARGCERICEPAIIQELWDAPAHQRLNLEHLDLQGVMFQQDAAGAQPGCDLARAVERLATDRLVSLRLGWLGEASPGTLQPYVGDLTPVLQLVGRCRASLRLLDLAGCSSCVTGDELLPVLSHLSALRALCMSYWQLSGELGPALQRCPTTQLAHLILRASDPLLDVHLAPLLAANPGLRSINLGCCGFLSDATLRTLAASCTRLESLDVCYATCMTQQGIRLVSGALPRLQEFGFSGIRGLSDADIELITTRLPGLRMIGIGGIPHLTDASLRCLAARCTGLESLYAADLPAVTPTGLAALTAACPRLRRVAVRGCTGLPAALLAEMERERPYVFDGDMLPQSVVDAEEREGGG